ncbi:unnamed protein product [Closterium sp. Naga37s-1]|nr:unnamed protein product [Closterium sp. Naga37s-1]
MRPLLLRRIRLRRRHLSKLPPASLRRGQRRAPPTTPRTRSHLRLRRYSPSHSRARSPTVVVLLGAVRRRIGGVVLLGVAPPHRTGMRIAVAAVAGGEVTVADAPPAPHVVPAPSAQAYPQGPGPAVGRAPPPASRPVAAAPYPPLPWIPPIPDT